MRKLLIPLLIIAVFGFGRTAGPVQSNPGRSFQIKKHDINQVEMSISNYGKFGQTVSGTAGCWWPKGSGHNYIFGAGPWFGTIDQTTGDTLVTIGYGPHGGEAEYGPGLGGWTISDPNAVIFLYPANFPPPADKYPMAPQAPKSHQDSWCAYNDLDATYHMAGDTRPIGLEVYQTVYAWNLTSTQDIIFIRYEVKNVSGHQLTNCFFGVATDNDIGNESGTGNDIISAILHRWYHFPGETDSILVDNLGYQWQEAIESGWKPEVPGTIGFDYLQSPYDLQVGADKDHDGIPDQYERDSSYYAQNVPDSLWDQNGNGVPGWRDPAEIPQFGMTAFKRFTLNLEPNRDNERYTTMAGYNFKTGAYEPYDTIPPAPDDQRFLQVSGPFTLEADSIATVLVGIVLATWKDVYGTPDSALAKIDATCQFIYDMNWLLPGPPPPPNLTCVPGDRKITLIWNNLSEVTPDPYYNVVHFAPPTSPIYDPYYMEYDFEGYRIWKSLTGRVSEWSLLGTFDKADGIKFTYSSASVPESLWIKATDNGVVHSFVDEDVRNGFNYNYAVTSFDYNYVKGVFDSVYLDTFYIDTVAHDTTWDYDTVKVFGGAPLTFESGQVGVTAVPRREAANYLPPGTPMDSVEFGNPLLDSLVKPKVTYSMAVDPNKPLYLTMEKPLLLKWIALDSTGANKRSFDGAYYRVFIKDASDSILDSILSSVKIGTGYSTSEFAAVNGISIACDIGTPVLPLSYNLYDSVTTAGYPDSFVVATVVSPLPCYTNAPNYCRGFWAYTGNPYRLIWQAAGGKSRTLIVIDLITGDTIPYQPYRNDSTTNVLGEGWCFTAAATLGSPFAFASHDTLQYRNPAGQKTKSLYIMGGMINLHKGTAVDSLILPAVGEEWIVWPNGKYLPPSVLGRIKIQGQPGVFDTAKVVLNVKVVPNPYVVHNEWQQSSLIRRIRFINLPDNCTVRIFNLNGELIRTILHTATIVPTSGQTVYNNAGGDEWWDLLSENRQLIASGVYIFHVDSKVGEQIGKFAVVR
jgi:hypothetical protein